MNGSHRDWIKIRFGPFFNWQISPIVEKRNYKLILINQIHNLLDKRCQQIMITSNLLSNIDYCNIIQQ